MGRATALLLAERGATVVASWPHGDKVEFDPAAHIHRLTLDVRDDVAVRQAAAICCHGTGGWMVWC